MFPIALPLGGGIFRGRIWLGVQALAVSAGLALMIIYLRVGDPYLWPGRARLGVLSGARTLGCGGEYTRRRAASAAHRGCATDDVGGARHWDRELTGTEAP